MLDTVQATCTDPAGEAISTDWGDRVVADFESTHGEEINIWTDADSREAAALRNLQSGQTVTLIQEQGKNGSYYKLPDSAMNELAGNGQAPPPQNAPPPGQPQEQKRSPQKISNEHARLIANTYAFLDKKFAEQEGNINQMPTSTDLQKMAVSAAIEAVR